MRCLQCLIGVEFVSTEASEPYATWRVMLYLLTADVARLRKAPDLTVLKVLYRNHKRQMEADWRRERFPGR